MSSRSMSRICGGGELYRCVTWSKLNLSGIIPPTTGALMSTVICFFNPASVNPPFSSTWQQQKKYSWATKEVQLSRQYGNPPVLPGTWRRYVFPVPLRSTLASQCLPDERKNSNSHFWEMLLLILIYLLQAPGLDHHRPPVARHGEHFEAELAKKINSKFHTRSPLSRTEPPLPVNVRGRVWKAGIDQGEESDAAAHLVS